MGLSSSKTVNTNEPPAWAKPSILKGLDAATSTYDLNQPNLQKFATMQQESYGRLSPGAERGIMGSQDLVNRNLSGGNLNGNPFLEGIIGKTRANVTNGVNDQFGEAGRFGSGMHAKILTDQLAEAENGLRFQNYGMERGYQQDGIGQAQQLMGGSQSLLNNAADLPIVGVAGLNGNVRQASNGFGTNTQKSTPNFGQMWLQAASQAAQAAAGSDPALKINIEYVATRPDGLDVYDFDYVAPPNAEIAAFMPAGRHRGVMADQVAKLRPDALGPVVGGFATVNYQALVDGEEL